MKSNFPIYKEATMAVRMVLLSTISKKHNKKEFFVGSVIILSAYSHPFSFSFLLFVRRDSLNLNPY